jgi:pimeloyl-ACP methyl ester carboxylesterase
LDVKRVVLVAALIAPLLAGCDDVVTGRPLAGGSVEWGPCPELPDTQMPADAQCGEILVPLDYSKPDGARARIAVARLPATGDKIGSLLINPGGPGLSGVDFLWDLFKYVPAKVRERFDLVGFDPRGVGQSRPAVDCNSDAQDDQDRVDLDVDNTQAGVAQTDKETAEYVQRCIDKNGEELLANVGTKSVARDMDLLRAALGDDKLNYLGYSYGTYIGATYAELFPERVRAMVLDGAVDPAVDAMQQIVDHGAAFQKAFDAYAADCARDPDCPLGTDPGRAVERLHELTDPLVDQPAGTNDPRGLSYPDAIIGVHDALFSPDAWPNITAGLAALRDRKPADDLLMLADEYAGRDSNGHYDNLFDVLNAVRCADLQYPTDPAAWVELDRKYREVSQFDTYGEFSGHASRGTCSFWPVHPGEASHAVSAPGLPRVLVISTTGDPATPYLDGVHLAEQMHAALLTVEGTQHTASFYGIPCVDSVVADYLIDLTLPPTDQKCSTGS